MIFYDFLKDLKSNNKKIFFFIVVVSCIYIENFIVQINDINYIQISPFNGYSMYSGKINDNNCYYKYIITVNNKTLKTSELTNQNKHIIQQSLNYIYHYKKNHNQDKNLLFLQSKLSELNNNFTHTFDDYLNVSSNFPKYINWHKRYLERTFGIKIKTLKTDLIILKYNSKNEIYITNKISLINHEWKKN
jgi:hypothetical protein